jgi:tetratricopeptide (TPR) repeat protein
MKKIGKKALLFTLGIAVSSISFGQKLMETSAASEYENKFVKAYGKRDLTGASEAILKAKEFIDQASTNDETKNNPKTQYYKAQIYLGLIDITKATSNDAAKIKEYQEIAEANMLSTFNNPNTKYKEKVEEYVNQKAYAVFQQGQALFTSKNFEGAMLAFIESNKIKNTLGSKMENADANAEVSFLNGMNVFVTESKFDEALKLASTFKGYYPNNRRAMLSLIDIQLKKSNLGELEKLTEEFTQLNPNDTLNKRLYYNLATVLLNNNEFAKAEQGFKKALSFDGMYVDAIYQLASTYISWAKSISKEASMLPTKDPKVKTLDDQANRTLLRGISALEKYTAVSPNDKDALITLSRAYGRVGNEAKSAEIKAKADAIK